MSHFENLRIEKDDLPELDLETLELEGRLASVKLAEKSNEKSSRDAGAELLARVAKCAVLESDDDSFDSDDGLGVTEK